MGEGQDVSLRGDGESFNGIEGWGVGGPSFGQAVLEHPEHMESQVKACARQVGGDHYCKRPIQPWDFIAANGLGFFEGNVVKYVTRWKDKGGVADLEKARHYLEKLIELQQP